MNKLLQGALNHTNKLCFIVYFVGVVWFTLLNEPNFSHKCYFSENALLPGVTRSDFSIGAKEISRFNQRIFSDSGDIHNNLIEVLNEIGLETHQQKFSFQASYITESPQIPHFRNGTNVYGISRAARAASTESLVINIPLRSDDKPNYAAGVAVALAKLIRGQVYWAKDVILLFTEDGAVGASAWLDSYHGVAPSSHHRFEQLSSRAGSIQAAVVLEFFESELVSYFNLKTEGFNGQLPNLDLFNLVVRLSKIEQVPVAVNHMFPPNRQPPHEAYLAFYTTTMRMMTRQATGRASGNHGAFLRHKVEALTVESRHRRGWRPVDLRTVGRIIEGVCRSLNNLLERLHQSFFFYLLPSTDRYLSIGTYMPPLGLVLLVPVIKALVTLVKHGQENTSEDSSTTSNEPAKDDGTTTASGDRVMGCAKMKAKEEAAVVAEAASDQQGKDPQSETSHDVDDGGGELRTVMTLMTSCHVVGAALHNSPLLIPLCSQLLSSAPPLTFLLLLVALLASGMSLPLHFRRLSATTGRYLYIATHVELAVVMGTVSVVNFSLAALLSAALVLATMFVEPAVPRACRAFALLLTSPLALLVAGHLMWSGSGGQVVGGLSAMVVDAYELEQRHRVWSFSFASLLYCPLWLQFWCLALLRGQ